MHAFILIVFMLTSTGPVERRIEFGHSERRCEAAARAIRTGAVAPPPGIMVISAECVHEYEA